MDQQDTIENYNKSKSTLVNLLTSNWADRA